MRCSRNHTERRRRPAASRGIGRRLQPIQAVPWQKSVEPPDQERPNGRVAADRKRTGQRLGRRLVERRRVAHDQPRDPLGVPRGVGHADHASPVVHHQGQVAVEPEMNRAGTRGRRPGWPACRCIANHPAYPKARSRCGRARSRGASRASRRSGAGTGRPGRIAVEHDHRRSRAFVDVMKRSPPRSRSRPGWSLTKLAIGLAHRCNRCPFLDPYHHSTPEHQAIEPAADPEKRDPVAPVQEITVLGQGRRQRKRDRAHVAQERVRRKILRLGDRQRFEDALAVRRAHLVADHLVDLVLAPAQLAQERSSRSGCQARHRARECQRSRSM